MRGLNTGILLFLLARPYQREVLHVKWTLHKEVSASAR